MKIEDLYPEVKLPEEGNVFCPKIKHMCLRGDCASFSYSHPANEGDHVTVNDYCKALKCSLPYFDKEDRILIRDEYDR